jgi:tRNA (guanine37-N1)-methyltransferase
MEKLKLHLLVDSLRNWSPRMRIDAISIFPDFFSVLDLSLLGKAKESGLIQFKAHDLRNYTHDRHRTVDDTPYGGGAGMVMKPEPWGEAFDEILVGKPTVIFTTPAGKLFNQDIAKELSTKEHLIFACGRYEGIDQRVVEYAKTKTEVLELSIGDYVLNGGEVAAIVMIEAICRLIPGVIGNSESLDDESHADGLLEYPSFTKPQSWRGLEVPQVLLSGHHAEIEAWRRQRSLQRTEQNRPDLL